MAARGPLLRVPLSTAHPEWARSDAVSRGESDSSQANGAERTAAAFRLQSFRRPFDPKSLSFLNYNGKTSADPTELLDGLKETKGKESKRREHLAFPGTHEHYVNGSFSSPFPDRREPSPGF